VATKAELAEKKAVGRRSLCFDLISEMLSLTVIRGSGKIMVDGSSWGATRAPLMGGAICG